MPAIIEIKGVDELIRKLGRATATETLRTPMVRSVQELQRRMADYPPQRPGSSYRRTGTLGRRWTTEITQTENGLDGRVGNNTEYGPFVQSDRFQARVHRGRWQTDRSVTEKAAPDILADFRNAIDRALAGR